MAGTYKDEQKNLAKFSDTCSIRAGRLCIGSPRLVGRGKAGNSSVQECFCTTLYNIYRATRKYIYANGTLGWQCRPARSFQQPRTKLFWVLNMFMRLKPKIIPETLWQKFNYAFKNSRQNGLGGPELSRALYNLKGAQLPFTFIMRALCQLELLREVRFVLNMGT